MVLFFVAKKWLRKKEKGHLVGYYMTRYTLAKTLAFQNGRRTITNNHTLTCMAFLAVNYPEIALTLEKCLIQGKIIVCFPWIERFFYELCDFSWYLNSPGISKQINNQ